MEFVHKLQEVILEITEMVFQIFPDRFALADLSHLSNNRHSKLMNDPTGLQLCKNAVTNDLYE